MAKQAEIRIGTSGYQYDHWRGIFYPEKMAKKDWFTFFAAAFDTVEINNTFYHLPQAATFDAWRAQAPHGFCFALKYSRFGSHLKHLKDPASHLRPFLERAERLKPHLRPILVQLPPQWGVAADRLEEFLAAAPHRRRWAIEFRHPSWLCDTIYRILRKYGAALCIHDGRLDVFALSWRARGGRRLQRDLPAIAGRPDSRIPGGRRRRFRLLQQ